MIINCHTGTAKETPYRSTLCDPQGKAEQANYRGHKAYAMGFLKCLKVLEI
ncbi:hypothetical protein U3516DRAFT_756151 [Neocallimastix sp. 'constans']